ncbi:immunoglobulin superfamily containing leucine-rich repeat protein 2-like [Corythoichthys intestinalis]|uniref:immunoglobulin superfamily containing leucine-rich repeat protein 2-like n=1 Tax=Corythoichthys intestinalis TaxID=161448 RepID=UPI0025A5F68A|nr:immunoglobulin superfamily containing leucine-rich repeat protein 2-like [Corythoichthys intestinalis]XP_057701189.1 immunoglobulin superfamily containing leucine-rich repeat protein 2-like [Corythoichthys intestinalis]XP_061796101.1 immunoglobulin superfamily containing leucine-rich repeat protein 2-like [Nerophis lumbriciformis]
MAVRVLTMVIVTLFSGSLGCPSVCTCSIKYGHYFADCSHRDLEEIPIAFPPDINIVTLSANKISLARQGVFNNATQMMSLWMAYNEIVSIAPGSLSPMVLLRNLDISHNKITDFPWEDLQTLTDLQMLKMNHNEMISLPRDAFVNLKNLRSLRLNNNKFTTVAEGTFDGLISLSHLQIFNNPFACTCYMDWFRNWLSTTSVTIPERNFINCATPESLQGELIENLTESKCTKPKVTVWTVPNIDFTTLYEGDTLTINCEFEGNPKPLVTWTIYSLAGELNQSFKDDLSESNNTSILSKYSVQIFNNGTLLISHLMTKVSGNYSCSASNEFGIAVDSISFEVVPLSEQLTAKDVTKTAPYNSTQQKVKSLSITNASDFESLSVPYLPNTEIEPQSFEELMDSSKCGLKAKKIHISSLELNGSSDDTNNYMFDFGVIALWVSETEATIRLNPLLMPKYRQANRTVAMLASLESPDNATENKYEEITSQGLYICVTTAHNHSPVLWSQVKEGLSTYLLSGLRPGTNYSLCLTYKDEDCEVQVLFTTKRKVPNLIIIITVSICLLTVSTVPLLGAMCFHLVYKYHSKTYKLILKARDQYQMDLERNRATNINSTPLTESQRNINVNQLNKEDVGPESLDGEKEEDTEESVATETVTLSQSRENLDDCEIGSDYSDRLPLGAEAVNITNKEYQ